MGAGAPGGIPAQATSDQAEGVVGGVVADPFAGVGAEEGVGVSRRAEHASPQSGVVAQRRQGAGM